MSDEKCKTRTNYISKLRSNIKEEQHIERTKVKTNVHFCIDIYVRRWKQMHSVTILRWEEQKDIFKKFSFHFGTRNHAARPLSRHTQSLNIKWKFLKSKRDNRRRKKTNANHWNLKTSSHRSSHGSAPWWIRPINNPVSTSFFWQSHNPLSFQYSKGGEINNPNAAKIFLKCV